MSQISRTPLDLTYDSAPLRYAYDSVGNIIGAVGGDGVVRRIPGAGAGSLPLINPEGLRRWRRAYSKALYNPPTINVIGDSIAVGIGSDDNNNPSQSDTTAAPQSITGNMVTLFARHFGGNEMSMILAGDSRNTLGGTCVVSNTTGFLGNPVATSLGALRIASGDSITISLPACTNVNIYYYESNGANGTPTTAAWQYDFDAAGATAVANGGGNNVLKVINVTGLSDATHSLVISGTAGTDAYIAGVEYFTPADGGVIVTRMGCGSCSSSDILGLGGTGSVISTNSFGQARMLQSMTVNSPDLVILLLGHNDCTKQNTQGTTVPVYLQNLTTIINAVDAAGGCVLILSEPDAPDDNPVSGGYTVPDYWEAAQTLATTGSNVAYAKLYDLISSYSIGNAAGLYTPAASSVHLSRLGYADVARQLFIMLNTTVAPELTA